MRKKVMVFLIIIGALMTFFGCNANKLTLISFGKGFGAEYNSNNAYPVILVKSEAELKLYYETYQNHINFGNDGYGGSSIQDKFKEYNEDYFKNNFLALQIILN